MDTTQGAVTVVPGTPPGIYTLSYELCDLNTPVNCATTLVTITVTPQILPVTESGSAVSGSPSAAIANVAANDTVNGLAATLGASGNASVVQSGTWPAGITLNPATGAVSTDATVQPGIYNFTYQLCDKNAPVNCATITDTITVTANNAPVDDAASMVAGSVTTIIANVTQNDAVNGALATLGTTGNATVATSGIWPSGITLNPTTGAIIVGARVQPGTYNLVYELCDKNTPVNCQTATAVITVNASIDPVADNGVALSGTPSTPIADIAANDTVNGTPALVSGSSGTARVSVVGSWPSGFSLTPTTGAVAMDDTVAPGTYVLPYQLCDKNVPANCANGTATVVVSPSILPTSKSASGVSGTPSTLLATIAAGDTVNGSPAQITGASPNASIAKLGTWPTGITLDPLTGVVLADASAQPGVYALQYQLCDTNTPINCAPQTVTITIAGNIAPVTDTGSAVSGTPSTPIANVAVNDMVNGAPATLGPSGNATLATSGTWPTGITLDPVTGAVSTSAAVQPGTYLVSYELCDKSTPANCQTQTVTVTIASNIAPLADTGSAISGTPSTPVANVASNDSVNGAPATLGPSGNATLATSGTWPTGITLDPMTGAIATSAAVQPGTYVMSYQLCDKSTPANCQTQTVTITVASDIVPLADAGSAVSGTPSTPVANVAVNDRVNGSPATLGPAGNATLAPSGTWPSGITLDPTTGAVSTSDAVQPDTYVVSYELCDKSTPANCATQSVTITVAGNIAPTADTGATVSGTPSTPIAIVTANDIVNGTPATLGPSGNATIATSGTWPTGITFDPATGAISTSAAVQPGTYVVSYQLCDKSSPTNCQTQTVTISVSGNIAPIADMGSAISGTPSTPVANVASNDSVNGSPATLGPAGNATIAPSGTWPTGIALDPVTGAVSTSASVQPGTYAVSYELCDKSTPANCATQTATVTVAGNIAPVADTGSAVSGTPSTPIANVASNDSVNGTPATLGPTGNATLAPSGTWPAGITLDPVTGGVTTSASVQPGTYIVSYALCDKSTPANCQSQTVTIIVSGNIVLATDLGAAISGTPSTPFANVVSNDLVNGAPAKLGQGGNATVAPTGVWPPDITLNPATGAVSTSAALQPGTYVVTYTLCDKSTPANCQNQTVTIMVSGNILPSADSGNATSGTPSTPITNVAANDHLNGVPAILGQGGNATVTPTGVWPTGITLDPVTGSIALGAAVPAGTYGVQYQQTATIFVAESRGSIAGIVYTDANADGQRQAGEPTRANWIVELVSNGTVIATATTDSNGAYRFDNITQSAGYEVRFRNPENNVVYGTITNIAVTARETVIDQNLPIDPAGVIFNSVTRAPIAGALVTLVDASGAPLPATCFLDASQRSQRTGPSGEYRFDLIPGAAPQCPRSETVYKILVTPPPGYSATSSVLLPLVGPFDPTGLRAPVKISPLPVPAATGEVPYYLTFRLAAGDPDVVFNHIALDPFLTRTPLVVTKSSILRTASAGDLVPYEITVRNTESVRRAGLTIVDVLPPGMKYVPGSATIEGVQSTPLVGDRELTWVDQTIPASTSIRYRLVLVVGAGVTGGEKVNTALARTGTDGNVVSNRGTAAISVVPSAVFALTSLEKSLRIPTAMAIKMTVSPVFLVSAWPQ
jgi:large repetitive protein